MSRADKRHVRKGRSRGPGFVMIYYHWMDLPAWQHLSGNGVKLLLAMMRLAKGDNGFSSDRGELFLSEKIAAELLGVSRNTASNTLDELEQLGFTRAVRKGHFVVKDGEKGRKATIWRLTSQPHPQAKMGPTLEFRDWKPDEPKKKTRAQKLTRTGPKIEHNCPPWEKIGSNFDPVEGSELQKSVDPLCSISEHHIDIPQGGHSAGDEGGDLSAPLDPPPSPLQRDPSAGADVARVEQAIRYQVLQTWSALDQRGRQAMAAAAGLTVDEVKRYLGGTLNLTIGKAMVLRAATKAAA